MSDELEVSGLNRNWDFQAGQVFRWQRRQTLEYFFRNAQRRPAWQEIKPVTPKRAWTIYFMFTPDATLSDAHRFTLSRLRDLGLPLLVVCATPDVKHLPEGLAAFCDALFWKDLPGYDFSAYTLALQAVSRASPGADTFVMNDSVFGPFSDFRGAIERSPWDLTGFTASNQLVNHIQSYAFALRGVDRGRMARLAPVFFPLVAISNPTAVVHVQEIRMARVAARSMKVGAFWFGDTQVVKDPTLVRPLELMQAGFPFLKKSLIGKHGNFIDRELVLAQLEKYQHPVDARKAA